MTDSPLSSVRITPLTVFIDGQELPGVIEAGGVIVKPGGGTDISRVTVTFLVGKVEVE